jgi:hypothetical protein
MKTVPRIGRILDLAGLLLFLGGAAVFVWAWIGFQGIPDYHAPTSAGAWAAIRVADVYWRLQKIGTGLMVAGLLVFGLAWWVARSVARGRSSGTA